MIRVPLFDDPKESLVNGRKGSLWVWRKAFMKAEPFSCDFYATQMFHLNSGTWNSTTCCWTPKVTSKSPISACARRAWGTEIEPELFAGLQSFWRRKSWRRHLTRERWTGGASVSSSSKCSSANRRFPGMTKRKCSTASSMMKSATPDSSPSSPSPSWDGWDFNNDKVNNNKNDI